MQYRATSLWVGNLTNKYGVILFCKVGGLTCTVRAVHATKDNTGNTVLYKRSKGL